MYVLFQDMLTQFMFSSIQSMVSTQLALQLARKFEKLGIDGLPVEDVYPSILDRYSEDILTVAGVYEKFKKKPDVARGAPPVAGTLCYLATFLAIAKTLLGRFRLQNYTKLN